MTGKARAGYTSVDYVAAALAFVRAYKAEFGAERGLEVMDSMSLPLGLTYHLRAALQPGGAEHRVFAVQGYARLTIHVEIPGAFTAEQGAYEVVGGAPDGGLRAQVEEAVVRAFSTTPEDARRLLEYGTVVEQTVLAENLSAAQRGVVDALTRAWEEARWPTNPQPYPDVKRDARWLFQWWCLGGSYDRISLRAALEEDEANPTPDKVRRAVRRSIDCLSFDRSRRPERAS